MSKDISCGLLRHNMPAPPGLMEGYYIDDSNNIIGSTYVDLRPADDRMPISTLVKCCEQQHAIESCMNILISKPTRFREYGENLIRDPSEAKSSHTEIISETINDPDDMADARIIDSEITRAGRHLQHPMKVQTHSIKTQRTKTESLSADKNGWIFCTSIEPKNQEENNEWRQSMPDGYDHITRICRPREFARSLAAMVSEQKGSRGSEEVATHVIDGYKFKTKHKIQFVYHGPVVYEKDPYARVINASTTLESTLLPIFTKKIEYSSQREYRFFIVTSKEPLEETVNLDVSPSMLGSIGKCGKGVIPQDPPTVTPLEDSLVPSDPIAENVDVDTVNAESNHYGRPRIPDLSFFDGIVDNPSVPISVRAKGPEDMPSDLHEMLTTYSAIEALRSVIGNSFRTGHIHRTRYVDVVSAVWHADRCIRRLCAKFEDPIENISVNDENFVVITIKSSRESGSKGIIFVGPYGTATFEITSRRRNMSGHSEASWFLPESVSGHSETSWFLPESMSEDLKKMGLRIRPNSSKQSMNTTNHD